MSIRAVLFDVYGTLLDVHALTTIIDRFAPGQGAALSVLWRQKQIDYTRIRTLSDQYEPFDRVTADGLDFACLRHGVKLRTDDRKALLSAYDRLPAHDEAAEALQDLRGIDLGVLSNGTPTMLDHALKAAGFDQKFRWVLSADTVRKYKTSPEVYRLGTQELGLPAEEIAFVSSNAWDAAGAAWFGYRVFWINRLGEPAEELGIAAEYEAKSLSELPAWVRRN
jgi:2-haloacid dehalogenase